MRQKVCDEIEQPLFNVIEVALVDVPSCSALPTQFAKNVTKYMDSIIKLSISLENGRTRSGTAWYLGHDPENDSNFDYFMTNHHVIHQTDKDTKEELKVSFITIHSSFEISVEFGNLYRVSEDQRLDYCIFRVGSIECPPKRLILNENHVTPRKGDFIANIGFPCFTAETRKFFEEKFPNSQKFSISKVFGMRAERIFHTTFTLPGSSGSILFDPETGLLIGLHTVLDFFDAICFF
jgi:hypothetical protein